MIFRRSKSVFYWYDFTVAGGRYRGSTKQTSKTAAQQYESVLMAQIVEQGPSALPKKAPAFRDFVPCFRRYIEKHNNLAPKSKAYYRDGIGLLLESAIASKRLDQIRKSDVQTLQLPGTASWQNCALRTLRRMLSQAKEWKLLREVPRVPLLAQRQRRDVFGPDIEQNIITEARQPLQDVYVMMMDTGCRPSEITGLEWDDILWDHRVIFIQKGKTKKSTRYVPLSDRVRDRLRHRQQSANESSFVFPSRRTRSGHVSISSLDKEFRRVCDLLGLPKDLVLYVARHSFATGLLDITGNIKLVADILGHADTKITGTYLHPSSRGLSSLINERNARRTAESTAHFTAHSHSEDFQENAKAIRAMLAQVAVPGRLRI
jgi:integrase